MEMAAAIVAFVLYAPMLEVLYYLRTMTAALFWSLL